MPDLLRNLQALIAPGQVPDPGYGRASGGDPAGAGAEFPIEQDARFMVIGNDALTFPRPEWGAEGDLTGKLPLYKPQPGKMGQNQRIAHIFNSGGPILSLEEELGFIAHSIIIDNPTPQWLFLPNVWRFVGPNGLGIVMNIPSGSQKAHVLFQSPPGIAQPGGQAGAAATVQWVEAIMFPSPGYKGA